MCCSSNLLTFYLFLLRNGKQERGNANKTVSRNAKAKLRNVGCEGSSGTRAHLCTFSPNTTAAIYGDFFFGKYLDKFFLDEIKFDRLGTKFC